MRRLIKTLSFATLLFVGTSVFAAESSSSVVNAVNKLKDEVSQEFETWYKEYILPMTTGAPGDLATTLSANTNYTQISPFVEVNAYQTSQQAVNSVLFQPDIDKVHEALAAQVPVKEKDLAAKSGAFNMGTLMYSLNLQPNTPADQNAKTLIAFLAGMGNQLQTLDSAAVSRADGTSNMNIYLTQLGTTSASYSAGVSVLTNLYQERVVKPGLGANAGMPKGQENVSLLALQKFIATRRVSNEDWYTEMSDADPATLWKELVFIEAEREALEFENKMQLEQTNMLLATIALELQRGIDKNALNVAKMKAVGSGAAPGM